MHPRRAFHVAHPLDHRSPVGAIANAWGARTPTKCGARRLSVISPLSEDRYVGPTVTATPESAGDDDNERGIASRDVDSGGRQPPTAPHTSAAYALSCSRCHPNPGGNFTARCGAPSAGKYGGGLVGACGQL